MDMVRVKIISSHQPNNIVEMDIKKAERLAAIGQVEILNGKKTINNNKGNRTSSKEDGQVLRGEKGQSK